MTPEKILDPQGKPVNEVDLFPFAYPDGAGGWNFWSKESAIGEILSKTKYFGLGTQPPRPGLTPMLVDGVWCWQEARNEIN